MNSSSQQTDEQNNFHIETTNMFSGGKTITLIRGYLLFTVNAHVIVEKFWTKFG
jgi:hypothetical protein